MAMTAHTVLAPMLAIASRGLLRRPVMPQIPCQVAQLAVKADEAVAQKKKRKKNVPTTAEMPPPPARPGKRRLRKLRYLQRQLPRSEFLRVIAESTLRTGSVAMEPAAVGSSTVSLVRTGCDLAAASDASIRVQALLVLDLNGILCHRIRLPSEYPLSAYRPPTIEVARTPVVPRPNLDDLLTRLDRHFCLAIWTSAKPPNAKKLLRHLIPEEIANRLLFVWSQPDCDVQAGNDDEERVFVKDLAKVWTEYPLWNAHNTLLMDDSPDKCLRQPSSAIHPPPLTGRDEDRAAVGRQDVFFDQLVEHWTVHATTERVNDDGSSSIETSLSLHDFLQHYRTW